MLKKWSSLTTPKCFCGPQVQAESQDYSSHLHVWRLVMTNVYLRATQQASSEFVFTSVLLTLVDPERVHFKFNTCV